MIVLMLMPVISILMFEHITISETLGNMDSGAFGVAYEFFEIEQDDYRMQELFDVMDDFRQKVAVISDGEADGVKVRSIYFNQSYVNLPMKNGRFFSKKDLIENYDCAVVGKNLSERVYQKNNKKYISIAGSEFEVIGVIGYECDTILDDYIYINAFSQKKVFQSNLYLMDMLRVKEPDELMENFVQGMEEKGIYVERLTGGMSFFNAFVPRILYSRWFLAALLCDVLCLVLLSLEWVNGQKKEICIRKLLGATTKNVLRLLGKRYLKIMLLTFLAGELYCAIFHAGYMRFLLAGYFLIIPVIGIPLICAAVQILKTPLEEAIK
ncbi:MAG: ABC transporter permease [Lachnospiraceae bacterium]|nr:ABC transporter permease [Lachnospiraceae bacterium]